MKNLQGDRIIIFDHLFREVPLKKIRSVRDLTPVLEKFGGVSGTSPLISSPCIIRREGNSEFWAEMTYALGKVHP